MVIVPIFVVSEGVSANRDLLKTVIIIAQVSVFSGLLIFTKHVLSERDSF